MSTHKISRSIMSILISLGLCMAYLPITRAVSADNSRVLYLYKKMLGEGSSEAYVSSTVLEDDSHGDLVGIYVEDLFEFVPEDIPDVEVYILQNSTVIQGDENARICLGGDSVYNVTFCDEAGMPVANRKTVSNDAPLFEGTLRADAVMSEEEMEALDRYLIDMQFSDNAYELEVLGDYTIDHPVDGFASVTIEEGGKLTIANEGNNDFTELRVYDLIICGELAIAENQGNPNGLRILPGGSFNLDENGVFENCGEGSVFMIQSDVTVTGADFTRGAYAFRNGKWEREQMFEHDEGDPNGIYIFPPVEGIDMHVSYEGEDGQIVLAEDNFIPESAYLEDDSIEIVIDAGFDTELNIHVNNPCQFDVRLEEFPYEEGQEEGPRTGAYFLTIRPEDGKPWDSFYDVVIDLGHGPQREDGMYFFDPEQQTLIDSISYNTGSGDVEVDDRMIPAEVYEDLASISITFTPYEGVALRVEVYDDMHIPVDKSLWSFSEETNTLVMYKGTEDWFHSYDICLLDENTIGPGPNTGDGMEIDFDNYRAKVYYTIPGGNEIEITPHYVITDGDLEGAESVSFRVEITDERYEFKDAVASFDVDGDGNFDDVRTFDDAEFEITAPEGGWGKKIDVNISFEEIQIDPDNLFAIHLTTIGSGKVDFDPWSIVDARNTDHGVEYMIEVENWDDIEIVLQPDTAEAFEVKRVTIDGAGVEVNNNRFTLPSPPPVGAVLEILVEFSQPDRYILTDIADHGYAYTIFNAEALDDETTIELLTTYFQMELDGWYLGENRKYAQVGGQIQISQPDVLQPADDEIGLPYAVYTLTLPDFSVDIPVYVMTELGFIIKTPKKTTDELFDYYVLQATDRNPDYGWAEDVTLLYDHDVGYPQIFGNGVAVVGAMKSDSSDVFSGHVNQYWLNECLGRDDRDENFMGPSKHVNVRLIIVNAPDNNTAGIEIVGEEDCAGWQFDRLATYTANTDPSKATDAYIYIANSYVTIRKVNYQNAENPLNVEGVEIDPSSDLSSDLITVEESGPDIRVYFNTTYDLIPLKLTYTDGSVRYVRLHRVALAINHMSIYPDGWTFGCEHGTGHTSRYSIEEPSNTDEVDYRALYGTYYYPTGNRVPASSDDVQLFVTITMADGSTESREITDHLNDTYINTNPIDEQTGEERSESDNPYCSDFLLWVGTEEEFNQIVKVEVIAYKTTTADYFGGVAIGSGRGVVWENN